MRQEQRANGLSAKVFLNEQPFRVDGRHVLITAHPKPPGLELKPVLSVANVAVPGKARHISQWFGRNLSVRATPKGKPLRAQNDVPSTEPEYARLSVNRAFST